MVMKTSKRAEKQNSVALRTPHSALRTPHSALRTPQVRIGTIFKISSLLSISNFVQFFLFLRFFPSAYLAYPAVVKISAGSNFCCKAS